MKAKKLIEKYRGCLEATEWVGDMTCKEAWETCHRGDWMLWIYKKALPYNLREITLAKGHCANTIRHLLKDKRSKKAIDVAIAFGMGEATIDDLNSAANDAYNAAYGVYAVTSYGAYDVANAADYAAFATVNINAATAASDIYADAYVAADYIDARIANRQQTADICREYLTPTMEKLWNH